MRAIAAVFALLLAGAAHAQFRESITVVRILVDVRVTDYSGNPITDLTPEDFDVKIGGKRAQVESVEWVEDVVEDRQSCLSCDEEQAGLPVPHGRLIILFVQTDFARNASRVHGQLNFLRYAEKMIEGFAPEDRIAVVQFDSHLKFRLDFTNDKEQVQQALRDTLRIDFPEWPPIVHEPSLASRLDRDAMRRAADSETGLQLLGNALRSIDGPKTLLLLGWGLGQLSNGLVRMKPRYRLAWQALDASRTTIFALDTSHADFHSLEIGLQRAAEDTGGFYAKTHNFPQSAVDRLQRTLAGHYEIELRRPDDLVPGTHDLRVRVKRRGVHVLAPSSYMDRH